MLHKHALRTRDAAKWLAEAVGSAGANRIGLWYHRRRTLVLAYHNVVPAGERPSGAWSLHLSQAAFAAQLDALARTHRVVPLATIDEEPTGDRPRAVVTFDDAYRGAVSVGVAELVKRRMPATIFVAPGLFETFPWWDRLAVPATGDLPRSVSNAALAAGAGRAGPVAATLGEGVSTLPEWAQIASEAEVRTVGRQPGITLGGHAWSHPDLTALDQPDLAEELTRTMAWLRGLEGGMTPWLAYPYGRTNAAVARATSAAGYAGAVRIDGGWLSSRPLTGETRFNIPRLNVPSGLSVSGFRLRIAGLLNR